MWYTGLTILLVFCAALAMRAKQLLSSVLWLACSSAVLSVFLYLIGAHELAVIELSVGAGLVTILIVFVLNLVSESPAPGYSTVYRAFSLVCLSVVVGSLALLILPSLTSSPELPLTSPFSFSTIVWEQRTLDTLLQLLLIFSGSLGVLSLVAEKVQMKPPPAVTAPPPAAPVTADAAFTAVAEYAVEGQVYDEPVAV